jgi:hypothetical protein
MITLISMLILTGKTENFQWQMKTWILDRAAPVLNRHCAEIWFVQAMASPVRRARHRPRSTTKGAYHQWCEDYARCWYQDGKTGRTAVEYQFGRAVPFIIPTSR